MKPLKILFGAVLILLIFIILYFSFIIIQAIATDYQPDEVEQLKIEGRPDNAEINDTVFTFLSWNIGYSGLGAEMDFFYDGGKMVHPTSELVDKYTAGILDFLESNDTIGFFLLQEVDRNSVRSGRQNQVKLIHKKLPDYSASFGINYKVRFVPLPFLNPLGRVEMGQLNLTRFYQDNAARYSYYSAYSWPKHLFMLDRCFVVSRFRLNIGKELVVINTHNSAYDSGGKLRQQEMRVIRDFMLKEFKAGNYVVAGGDWNQNPPDFKISEMNQEYHAV